MGMGEGVEERELTFMVRACEEVEEWSWGE